MSWETRIEWDRYKAFLLQNLMPHHLLVSLRKQRSRQPGYGYCSIVYEHLSNTDAAELDIDDLISRANDDEDIRSALARINDYGFRAVIGTYDEPSGRDLQISVKQDEEAELAMRIAERLD